MAKQDVLDAINATIVENGKKGITAQSLNNILTMIVENAGEGGSGEGALRVMIPMSGFDMEEGSEFVFSPEYWAEIGPMLDTDVPGAFDALNPVVEEIFIHNAQVYQQLMEKGVNREGVMCLLDSSAFTEAYLRLVGPLSEIGEININALSLSTPSSACIVDGEPQYFFELGLGGMSGTGIVIEPIVVDSYNNIMAPFTQVQLLSDGSVKMSIGGNTNCIFIPEEQDVVLSDRYKKANLSVREASQNFRVNKIVEIDSFGRLNDDCRYCVLYGNYSELYFFDELEIKKVFIENDGTPTVTTLGTINLTTA